MGWRTGIATAAALAAVAALVAACGSSPQAATSTRPAEPAVRQIAFTRDSEIWSVDSDGSGLQRLIAPTGPRGTVQDARWSPDGARIAFLERPGRRTEQSQVMVADAGGGGRRAVTPIGPVADPAWSPDGRSIAYLRDRVDRRGRALFATDVWIVPAEGGTARRLPGPPGGTYDYAWSPDGRRLALIGDPDPRACGCGPWELYVVGADGTGLRNLTRTPYEESNPSWLDDGTAAVIRRNEVVAIDTGDGTVRRLSRRARAYQAVPSPDGTRIALLRAQANGMIEQPSLWLLDVADGRMTPLVTGRIVGIEPSWSPDGRQIALVARPVPRTLRGDDAPRDVYVADVATRAVRPATGSTPTTFLLSPAFRPGEHAG